MNIEPLNINDYAALVCRGWTIRSDAASLTVTRVRPGNEIDRRFVMEGPSGVHSLLVDATDLDRLNAHWVVFAGHALNRYAA